MPVIRIRGNYFHSFRFVISADYRASRTNDSVCKAQNDFYYLQFRSYPSEADYDWICYTYIYEYVHKIIYLN